jgi:GT2 family glycosyltransferase
MNEKNNIQFAIDSPKNIFNKSGSHFTFKGWAFHRKNKNVQLNITIKVGDKIWPCLKIKREDVNKAFTHLETNSIVGFEGFVKFGDGIKYVQIQAENDGIKTTLASYIFKCSPSHSATSIRIIEKAEKLWINKSDKYTRKEKRHIVVIIPVYRGVKETKECIESILESKNEIFYNVLVINDNSPDPDVESYLQSLNGSNNLTVIKNEKNLGFVASVNLGMSLSSKSDVILLNSDTQVADHWIDKICNQAYLRPETGTVTPLSNNATICSYPSYDGAKIIPHKLTLTEIDRLAETSNPGGSIPIPTAVGFCMYIKRATLNDVGLFDADAFGKGYGEENDFCLRASHRGWGHILALDTFVYHVGEISFSETSKMAKSRAESILLNRHPNYNKLVQEFIAKNEGYQAKINLQLEIFKKLSSTIKVVISHNWGGGIEKFIQENKQDKVSTAGHLFIRPGENGGKKLELQFRAQEINFNVYYPVSCIDELADLIRSLRPDSIELNHVIQMENAASELLSKCGLPFAVIIHDYYFLCPTINFWHADNHYCGEPNEASCNQCLNKHKELPLHLGSVTDIQVWRNQMGWFLNHADKIIAPSHDTARRVNKYHPDLKIDVRYHDETHLIKSVPGKRPHNKKSKALIGILGYLDNKKGLSVINQLNSTRGTNNFDLILVGKALGPTTVKQTGAYEEKEIYQLLSNNNIDSILFASQCPETFSYTLSIAIRSNLHIIIPSRGSFTERLANYENKHVYDPEAIEELHEYLNNSLKHA